MAVTMTDDIYGRIMKVVGYPMIDISDLSNGAMTRQQLQDIVIKDALLEYWSWFPKKNRQEYTYLGEFEIPFPNSDTVGVIDSRVTFRANSGGIGSSGNPFYDMRSITSISSSGGYGGGVFGTRYNYDMNIAYESQRMGMQSQVDKDKTLLVNVDYANKKITGYNNTNGLLNITWAEAPDNFSAIPIHDLHDVIKLSQAYVLYYFGDLRNQIADSTPADIDGADFVSRADDLKDEVIEKWKAKPKIVVMR